MSQSSIWGCSEVAAQWGWGRQGHSEHRAVPPPPQTGHLKLTSATTVPPQQHFPASVPVQWHCPSQTLSGRWHGLLAHPSALLGPLRVHPWDGPCSRSVKGTVTPNSHCQVLPPRVAPCPCLPWPPTPRWGTNPSQGSW